MAILSNFDHIRYQLRLMELESEHDQEALARNLLTEQEAQERAKLRGIQRQNISWWLAKEGGEKDE